jgi:hypothetical protein
MPFTLTSPKTLLGAALALTALSSQAVTLVGLTSSNQVARIDTANVAAATSTAISGLDAGDRFVGIDLRPGNNTIYGVTLSNKLYTLNELTGVATFVAGLSSSIVNPSLGYGIDFNPAADFNGAASLRFVSSAGDNYAINANTGAVTVATSIAAGFSGVGYTNSKPNPTSAPAAPSLYYINSNSDSLAVATSAFNNPTINTVGSLGVDVLRANGFEVLADGSAYAGLNVDGSSLTSGIYRINLATGAATSVGTFNGTLSGLTVSAVPEPQTYALMMAGLGLVGAMAKRRKSA